MSIGNIGEVLLIMRSIDTLGLIVLGLFGIGECVVRTAPGVCFWVVLLLCAEYASN